MTETALTIAPTGAQIAEQVVIKGDLSKLTEVERMAYYTEVCRSLGLNPLTRPFEYITLNSRLTLYATRAAGDQLRAIRGITITGLDPRQVGDLFVVVATGRDRTGREDSSTGAVATKGLSGEALANAMMKAETKAKRRLTLSLAGLGWSDETEVESLAEVPLTPRPSLAERAATRAAEIATPAESLAKTPEEAAADVVAMALQTIDRPDGILNAEEVAEGAQPLIRTGLSAQEFTDACRHGGVLRGAVARAIGCTAAELDARVAAMTHAERGVLADELNLDWRGGLGL